MLAQVVQDTRDLQWMLVRTAHTPPSEPGHSLLQLLGVVAVDDWQLSSSPGVVFSQRHIIPQSDKGLPPSLPQSRTFLKDHPSFRACHRVVVQLFPSLSFRGCSWGHSPMTLLPANLQSQNLFLGVI